MSLKKCQIVYHKIMAKCKDVSCTCNKYIHKPRMYKLQSNKSIKTFLCFSHNKILHMQRMTFYLMAQTMTMSILNWWCLEKLKLHLRIINFSFSIFSIFSIFSYLIFQTSNPIVTCNYNPSHWTWPKHSKHSSV